MTLEWLIQQARDEGKYLYCSYQNLWFSPDELEQSNKEGRFRWGAVNWVLRSPDERLEEMYKSVEYHNREIRAMKSKMDSIARVFSGSRSQFDDVEPR